MHAVHAGVVRYTLCTVQVTRVIVPHPQHFLLEVQKLLSHWSVARNNKEVERKMEQLKHLEAIFTTPDAHRPLLHNPSLTLKLNLRFRSQIMIVKKTVP